MRVIVKASEVAVYTSFDGGRSWWSIAPDGVVFQSFQHPPRTAQDMRTGCCDCDHEMEA